MTEPIGNPCGMPKLNTNLTPNDLAMNDGKITSRLDQAIKKGLASVFINGKTYPIQTQNERSEAILAAYRLDAQFACAASDPVLTITLEEVKEHGAAEKISDKIRNLKNKIEPYEVVSVKVGDRKIIIGGANIEQPIMKLVLQAILPQRCPECFGG